jgi:hypothetical protein
MDITGLHKEKKNTSFGSKDLAKWGKFDSINLWISQGSLTNSCNGNM